MNEKYLEKCIKDNLKVMIDGSAPVDIDKSWKKFEKRLNEEKDEVKEGNKNKTKSSFGISSSISIGINNTYGYGKQSNSV